MQLFIISDFRIGGKFFPRVPSSLHAEVIDQKGTNGKQLKRLDNNVGKIGGLIPDKSLKVTNEPTRRVKSTVSIEEIGNIKVDDLIKDNKQAEVETNEPMVTKPDTLNAWGSHSTDMTGYQAITSSGLPLPKTVVETFQAGRYKETIELIKVALESAGKDAAVRERLLRLAADCHFLLGDQDRQNLLSAIDQYKTILRLYPDPAKGNDIAYFRMAYSYEKLIFYYEAIASWERLALAYPDSAFASEAPFRIGEILQITEKYGPAIESFNAYLKKHPEGKFAKMSSYYIGDNYYRMGKSVIAGDWYDDARKKWPEYYDIPKATLKNMGDHYYKAGKYSDTFKVLSTYVSMYPDDGFSKEAIYKLARLAQEMGKSALSLKIYSNIINKYNDIAEANNCNVEMANIGIDKPGVRIPSFFPGVDSYFDPLIAYDKLLAKATEKDQAAKILFLKATALWKLKNSKEAVITLVKLITHFPDNVYSSESRSKLREYADLLINKYYDENDHLSVADIYLRSYGKSLILMNDYEIALKVGDVLRNIGLHKQAFDMYATFKALTKDNEKEALINLAVAQISIQTGNYDSGEKKLLEMLESGTITDLPTVSAVKRTLADLYYHKKLYAKAASLYAEVLSVTKQEGALFYYRYARSLLSVKMKEGAIKNYLEALSLYEENPQKYDTSMLAEIYIGMGEAYYSERKFQEGMKMYRLARQYLPDFDGKRWLDYRIGQAYVGMEDLTEAKKSFEKLMEAGGGNFWPKVADYGLISSTVLRNSKGN